MNTQLHNKIMRRIYYAYILRVSLQPAILHGFFMLAMLISLTYFVSIGNVLQNMSAIPLGKLGTYAMNSVLHTEIWTLFILGALIFSAFSFRFSITPEKRAQAFARV